MIDKQIMYGCHCDNCGTHWINEEEGIALFADENGILNEVRNFETWHTDGPFGKEKHYCPDCFTITDNDELIIDTSRTKIFEEQTKEPSIKEEPKDHIPDIGKMIGEDELKEKFKHAINESDFHVPEFISNVKLESEDYSEILEHETNILANCCTEIAKQYANSKLDELEKWCDEQFKHADALDKQEDTETRYWGGKKDGINLAKIKISSLKR